MTVALYSWRRKDPRTGRWRVLGWKMTDNEAARWAERKGTEVEKALNSEETRAPVAGYGAVFIPARSSAMIAQDFAFPMLPLP